MKGGRTATADERSGLRLNHYKPGRRLADGVADASMAALGRRLCAELRMWYPVDGPFGCG